MMGNVHPIATFDHWISRRNFIFASISPILKAMNLRPSCSQLHSKTDIRHKIGYGKPLGLGTIQIIPTKLTIIDYAARYSGHGGNGKTVHEGDDVWLAIYDYTNDFMQNTLVQDGDGRSALYLGLARR